MKTVFDRSFKYTRSVETDVRKTFARVRREQRRIAHLVTSPTRQATAEPPAILNLGVAVGAGE